MISRPGRSYGLLSSNLLCTCYFIWSINLVGFNRFRRCMSKNLLKPIYYKFSIMEISL
jgi:hypothetical protein